MPQGCIIVSFDCSSQVSHTLPSSISKSFNLLIGTQERSWRLGAIPYKKKGDRKASVPRSPTGFWSVSLGLKVYLICEVLPGPPWWLRWQRIHLQCRRPWFYPWVWKIPWRRARQPTPVFLPGESPRTEQPGGLQSMGSQRVRHD